MKVKKIIGIAAIVFFCACAIFSGVVFAHQYKDAKNSAEQFENLRQRRPVVPRQRTMG